MKIWKYLVALAAVALCLCACGDGGETNYTPSTFPTGETEETGETSATEQTPIHSAFYLEGYTAQQVITYFAEVVLDVEYSTGTGNVQLVQKWTQPLRYVIFGEATQTDRERLERLFARLNEIEGFPGIAPNGENELATFSLGFYDRTAFNRHFSSVVQGEEADGAVEYWYFNETNQIYDARIGYRTDVDQYTRNSVLLEEVINGLGITDTNLRPDSITYQGFSQTQELSDMDWLILRLLYHPDIKCGMNLEQCKAVIEALYY